MKGDALERRANEAAVRFLKRRGYEVLDESWQPEGIEGKIDIVATDEDTLVFCQVDATLCGDEGFPADMDERTRREILAASWLSQHECEADVTVRFDTIGMIVLSEDRALIRHHINCMGEAC